MKYICTESDNKLFTVDKAYEINECKEDNLCYGLYEIQNDYFTSFGSFDLEDEIHFLKCIFVKQKEVIKKWS
ncbi:MAG: hypothetical protein RSC65_01765 [Malacoplasma sp.]